LKNGFKIEDLSSFITKRLTHAPFYIDEKLKEIEILRSTASVITVGNLEYFECIPVTDGLLEDELQSLNEMPNRDRKLLSTFIVVDKDIHHPLVSNITNRIVLPRKMI
jgi:hypothetical protein